MKTLIISCIHNNPYLVLQQLHNYHAFHGDCAIHILHESRESKHARTFEYLYRILDESSIEYFVVPDPGPTSYASCVGGILTAWSFAKSKLDLEGIDSVYLHTDGDLLVQGDFRATVSSGVGLPPVHAIPNLSESWFFYGKAKVDSALEAFARSYGHDSINELRNCRIEGAFFPLNSWTYIADEILRYLPLSYLENWTPWPVEEVLIPTICTRHFPSDRYSYNVVQTPSDVSRNSSHVTISHIKDVLTLSNSLRLVGLKWFSRDTNNSARHLALALSHARHVSRLLL